MIDQWNKKAKRRREAIVEEIREIRQKHAQKFDYDPDAIFEDLKRHQNESDYEVVSFPARRIARRSKKERHNKAL